MQWFKFYGQDFLTDPKIRHLSPNAKLFWVILLALANSEDKKGLIQNISEEYIFELAGLSRSKDEWNEEKNFLTLFKDLKMIEVVTNSNVTGLIDIVVLNFDKRQNQDSSNAERQRRFRERQKAKSGNSNASNVTLHNESNARVDKNRIDKNRIEKERDKEKKYNSLTSLTDETLQEIADKYLVPLAFVRSKLDDMTNWLTSKGKTYKNYKAALMNWVKNDALKIIQQKKDGNSKVYDATGV